MFYVVESKIIDQQQLIVVTFTLPPSVCGIADLEVFVDERRKSLVANVAKIESRVDLDPENRFDVAPGSRIIAKHHKKRKELIITVPALLKDVDRLKDSMSTLSFEPGPTISKDLHFSKDSPIRIEIRPAPIGRCVVANRRILPGETILFEEPLALLRLGEADNSAPAAAQCPEWQLTKVDCAYRCILPLVWLLDGLTVVLPVVADPVSRAWLRPGARSHLS
jgi:hypothetical protein